MKLSQSTDRIVGLIYVILITMLIALLFDNTANATDRDGEQRQDQAQDQDQQQYQDQWQSQDQQNEQNATVNNTSETKVFAAGASSGDSTSTCQQVRDLRVADGFLFGIRWDLTDKDCRRLGEADKADSRGDTYFADTLRCTVGFVLDAFDGDVAACKDALERNSVVDTLQAQIKQLEDQKADLLSERAIDQEQCEAAKDRIVEGCGK